VHEFLPFIVIGITTGAVYGLAGIGLVLTYKTSDIFNFGYGAIAALIAYCFYFLNADHGWPWPLAAVVSVLVFAPMLGLLLELMARSLDGASETIKVVATVGIIIAVVALGLLWHPSTQPVFPHVLPQSTVNIADVNVTWEQIILFVFSAAASAALYWFFRKVRLGIVMRGVVDSHELVSMSGDNPVAVRRWAWIIGTIFAGFAGLLLAPSQYLDGVTLTTAVFAAFGAAAIGYFSNLPLTFLGGLLIGVASALSSKYTATVDWLGGLPPALPFIVLFVVLIVLPRRLLVRKRLTPSVQVRRPYHAPPPLRLLAGAAAVTLLALVPAFQGDHLVAWSAALIDMVMFLSLGLLVRRSGQISLCQLGFAAVGAAAFGHFAAWGVPWLLALALAALVAVPVGALIAIPAVRVSGVFLALATLGFGIVLEQLFYRRDIMFGPTVIGIAAPRPNVSVGAWDLSSNDGFYYLLLIIMVLVVLAVTVISHGRLGRLLEAMADSKLALETQGATSSVLKVIVFCLAAAMAAIAGALTAMLYHYGVGTYFPTFNSLTLVVLVVIITIGEPWYAILAAIGYRVIPAYLNGFTTTNVLNLIFGVSACAGAYVTRFGGTPAPVREFLDRLGGRTSRTPAAEALPLAAEPNRREATAGPARADHTAAREGLEIRRLSVRFGGVIAVNGVSLRAPMGVITGLVGPNGAGKTTTFNACSGLVRPSSGRVYLHGVDVTREGSPERARRGLGRTFQRTELFNSLSVRQNIALGREASMAGCNPARQLVGSPSARVTVASATDEALELTGTTRIAHLQAGLLPIGQRRLVELARALAGPFDLLLLDEPSSGLDGRETEQFAEVLKTIVREHGDGILLVEHDMTLVRNVCDYLYVLDFGALIFEGTPEQMHESDKVRGAYLGDAIAIASSPDDLYEGSMPC
jgi:ABC-type branched-subunit amino acid transport system ATPase component/branched-subunit amino acid ABC-type transport system permease component